MRVDDALVLPPPSAAPPPDAAGAIQTYGRPPSAAGSAPMPPRGLEPEKPQRWASVSGRTRTTTAMLLGTPAATEGRLMAAEDDAASLRRDDDAILALSFSASSQMVNRECVVTPRSFAACKVNRVARI